MSSFSEKKIAIESDGATLDARLSVPDSARAAVVFCHPHPQYGGDMDNPVVTAVVSALAEEGCATLRFNFRGVGASTGSFGEMVGERSDAAAALSALVGECGGVPTVLGGYSFGALIAFDVGLTRSDLAALLCVAPPFGMVSAPAGAADKPVVMLVGDNDQFCPVDAFDAAARSIGAGVRSEVVAGADHFMFGFDGAVADRAARLLSDVL